VPSLADSHLELHQLSKQSRFIDTVGLHCHPRLPKIRVCIGDRNRESGKSRHQPDGSNLEVDLWAIRAAHTLTQSFGKYCTSCGIRLVAPQPGLGVGQSTSQWSAPWKGCLAWSAGAFRRVYGLSWTGAFLAGIGMAVWLTAFIQLYRSLLFFVVFWTGW